MVVVAIITKCTSVRRKKSFIDILQPASQKTLLYTCNVLNLCITTFLSKALFR